MRIDRHLVVPAILSLLVASAATWAHQDVTASQPSERSIVPPSAFKPVALDEVPDDPSWRPNAVDTGAGAVRAETRHPGAHPSVLTASEPAAFRTWPSPPSSTKGVATSVVSGGQRYVNGKASWYCKAGVSICHHSYPPGSMVAAACGKLRAAMGPHWRGKTVIVQHGSDRVAVRLVDWCGSKDKLIDLYWEPMSRLGGSGVLRVSVRW